HQKLGKRGVKRGSKERKERKEWRREGGFIKNEENRGQNNYDDPFFDPSKYAPYENELSNLIFIIIIFPFPIGLFDSATETTSPRHFPYQIINYTQLNLSLSLSLSLIYSIHITS
ncbi:LOW QUALITY PROTEIN: hypothetical protein TorRG33x02_103790, partial [Trema orientale]